MMYTTYIGSTAPVLVGAPGNCPACPSAKTALHVESNILRNFSSYLPQIYNKEVINSINNI